MFYLVDENFIMNSKDSGYRFVYDDSDNSVEFCKMSSIYELGLNIGIYTGQRPNFKRGSANWFKLKMLSFLESGDSLTKPLFEYTINGELINMGITVNGLSGNGNFVICKVLVDKSEHVDKFIVRPDFNMGWVCNSINGVIFLYIPDMMIQYVVNLCGRRDFWSIMSCTGNLFGDDIVRIVSDFSGELDIKFIRWL